MSGLKLLLVRLADSFKQEKEGLIMFAEKLQCIACKSEQDLKMHNKCPVCGGILEVKYRFDKVLAEETLRNQEVCNLPGIWKFLAMLPLVSTKYIVSLGEGNTPVLGSKSLGPELGLRRLFFKLESLNPSGSFKDRGISVAISKAKELGVTHVVVASTGNASASTAAYAARAGMKCVVCVPENTSRAKVSQAMAHGARIVLVRGDFSKSYEIALQASEKLGWANTSTTFLNPYNMEGNKTVAYELWQEFHGNVPDVIVIPVGAGPLLAGVAKGFEELRELGMTSTVPRLVGVQAEECSPIFDAFDKGLEKVSQWERPFSTLAAGVGDPLKGYSDDGTFTLDAIKRTHGTVVTLDEEEIRFSTEEMARLEGLFIEPTSSISAGAIRKLKESCFISEHDLVVSLLTGHGLKHFLPMNQKQVVISDFKEFELALL